ncbi:hypothetical protein LC55x_0263 [Lysobacter capsici]|nr:hypothetical protein LC55x_0263 [Lysobacter capsici]
MPAKAGFALLRRSRTSRDFSAIPPERHSREGGNPEASAPPTRTSFPRKRESSDFECSRTKGPGCSATPK